GVALNGRQVKSDDVKTKRLIKDNFNSLSPENGLKWQLVHPEPDRYDFTFGDEYVALGEEMGALTIGHCLVWHQQVPRWVRAPISSPKATYSSPKVKSYRSGSG